MDIQNEFEEYAEELHVCHASDTLQEIFMQFATTKVHRIICIDEEKKSGRRCFFVGFIELLFEVTRFLCYVFIVIQRTNTNYSLACCNKRSFWLQGCCIRGNKHTIVLRPSLTSVRKLSRRG